jgi:hypothetical protein
MDNLMIWLKSREQFDIIDCIGIDIVPLQDLFVLRVVDEGTLDHILVEVETDIHHVVYADEAPTHTHYRIACQPKPRPTTQHHPVKKPSPKELIEDLVIPLHLANVFKEFLFHLWSEFLRIFEN